MRVRWTPAAAADLQHIFDYLIEHDPRLARPTITSIRDAILSLKTFPNRGRLGVIDGTRELLHGRLPHIVTYRVREETIEIAHPAPGPGPSLSRGHKTKTGQRMPPRPDQMPSAKCQLPWLNAEC